MQQEPSIFSFFIFMTDTKLVIFLSEKFDVIHSSFKYVAFVKTKVCNFFVVSKEKKSI